MRLPINRSGHYVLPDDLRFGSREAGERVARDAETDNCPRCGTATIPTVVNHGKTMADPTGYWTLGATPRCMTPKCDGARTLG